ncbi:hypothetical protein N3K66_000881 [Trichothecium roseum]|uniref:Uncharacterized protein n=1 Tax=Trichothecium roseum TaxID=47278 RepID=A0ACC0VD96_9HYPO|nr:hypothetical protein N3K66_000881 [Trichothecium roseum]
MLAESPMMMEWIGMVCEEMWPAATQAVPALVKWPKSQEPQHSGFALAHGLNTHVFDMLADQPQLAERFANAMVYFSFNANLAPHHLCDAFDWAPSSHIVNVGESTGSTAAALAARLPRATIVIQDQPALEDQARGSSYEEGLVRGFGLVMMELFNARERERRDWEVLFGEADSRFCFDGVRTVPGADLAFISATWKPA